MPAKNVYHDEVIAALVADGWTITDDPLTLAVGERNIHIDLGAERPVGTDRVGVVLPPSRFRALWSVPGR
ncbi:MAG TPA: element excision factor XisH family protein [Fimbriiglobus sp.]|jgi:hypothetical protein|nr:element excision factor XisH family protein [Fimbriiglobus sp.]